MMKSLLWRSVNLEKREERKMPNFPVFLGFHLVTEIWIESWLRDWLNGYYIFICYQKLYDQIRYYS